MTEYIGFKANHVYDSMVVERLIGGNSLIARAYFPDGSIKTEMCQISVINGNGRSIETVTIDGVTFFADFVTTQRMIDELKRVIGVFDSIEGKALMRNVVCDVRTRERALIYGQYVRFIDALNVLDEHLSEYCKVYSENYNDETVDEILEPIDVKRSFFNRLHVQDSMRMSEKMAWIKIADISEDEFYGYTNIESDTELILDTEYCNSIIRDIELYDECVLNAISYMRA